MDPQYSGPDDTGPDVVWEPKKPQRNYLLKPAYRAVNQTLIHALSEPGAIRKLAEFRWGDTERQVCPGCGTIDCHYWSKQKLRWECRSKACRKQFTVFSGTKLHGTKMPAKQVLAALLSFVEAKDGISSRELSGLYGRDHQTMHVFSMKVREALRHTFSDEPELQGYIQADAAYFIKYVRPGNIGTRAAFAAKSEQKNAGLDEAGKAKSRISKNMHALVVFVQAGGSGQRRYRVAVLKTESQLDLLKLGQQFCTKDSVLMTDQHSGYNFFSGEFEAHLKVNHQAEFRTADGIHTNYAESFFARMRAGGWGAWHRMSVQNLEDYGWEMAWRQSVTHLTNLEQLADLFRRICASQRAQRYRDYWKKLPPDEQQQREEPGVLRELELSEVPKKRGRPKAASVKPKKPPAPKKRGSYRMRTATSSKTFPSNPGETTSSTDETAGVAGPGPT